MTRNHDPFDLTLASLRKRVITGQCRPGQPIVIQAEALRLGVSTSPVREALSWLSGEGLVERARSGGYFAPALTTAILRDRYRFRLMCLISAVRLDPAISMPAASDPDDGAALFDLIAERSGSPSLIRAYRWVSAFLSMHEAAERALIIDASAEMRALENAHAIPGAPGLIEALIDYHQRRIDLASVLLIATLERTTPKEPDPQTSQSTSRP